MWSVRYLNPDNAGGPSFESETNSPASPSASDPALTSNRHYLTVDGAVVGVLVSTGNLPSVGASDMAPPSLSAVTLNKVEYWHLDYQNSLTATTDQAGTITERYAYDPFGKRRYTNGSYDAAGNLILDWSATTSGGSGRGYTGHEQLDDIGLTHMNGRIYDATIGRMLQADPIVSDLENLQHTNRYAYVWNNPFQWTDPTGYAGVGNTACKGEGDCALQEGRMVPKDQGEVKGQVPSKSIDNQKTQEPNIQAPKSDGSNHRFTNADLENQNEVVKTAPAGGDRDRAVGAYNIIQEQVKPTGGIQGFVNNLVNGALIAGAGSAPIQLPSVDVIGHAGGVVAAATVELRNVVNAEKNALGRAMKGKGKNLPDSTIVCRGGLCTAERFAKGSGVKEDAEGRLSGISTGIGDSIWEASTEIPNNQMGVTTVGEIRAVGGVVDNNYGNHANVSGITAEQAAKLFSNIVKNPHK